jgi:hypothetical protein
MVPVPTVVGRTFFSQKAVKPWLGLPARVPRIVPMRPSAQRPTVTSPPSSVTFHTVSQPGPMSAYSVSTPWTP